MQKNLMVLVLVTLYLSFLVGCGIVTPNDEGSWNMSAPLQTEIVPKLGQYTFNQRGNFSVIENSQTGQRYVHFASDSYRFDDLLVINGAFYFEWGQIVKGHYPSDGYAISGSFVSETRATGYIKYAGSGHILSEGNFVAELKSSSTPTPSPTPTLSPLPSPTP